jgi:hypothetical protein
LFHFPLVLGWNCHTIFIATNLHKPHPQDGHSPPIPKIPFMSTFLPVPSAKRGGGFIGNMIRWFIMVAIYDICIGALASALGVSRMVACFIFIGILLAISFVGYIVRQKMSPAADA